MSPRTKRTFGQKLAREVLRPLLGGLFAIAVVLPFLDASLQDVALQLTSGFGARP